MKKQDRFDKVPWTYVGEGKWSHISGAVVQRMRQYPPAFRCEGRTFQRCKDAKQWVEANAKAEKEKRENQAEVEQSDALLTRIRNRDGQVVAIYSVEEI